MYILSLTLSPVNHTAVRIATVPIVIEAARRIHDAVDKTIKTIIGVVAIVTAIIGLIVYSMYNFQFNDAIMCEKITRIISVIIVIMI